VTARDPNIEQDVRAIVRNIVDGLWGDDDVSADTTVKNPDARATEEVTTVAVGGDHGGFALKERLAFKLSEQGFEVIDCGTDSPEAVDYPDIAAAVARRVASGEADAALPSVQASSVMHLPGRSQGNSLQRPTVRAGTHDVWTRSMPSTAPRWRTPNDNPRCFP